jgi:hypothetical protein
MTLKRFKLPMLLPFRASIHNGILAAPPAITSPVLNHPYSLWNSHSQGKQYLQRILYRHSAHKERNSHYPSAASNPINFSLWLSQKPIPNRVSSHHKLQFCPGIDPGNRHSTARHLIQHPVTCATGLSLKK